MAADPHFDASALVLNPMLLVATTRKPVNGARGTPWFGTERALNMTIARATLTPPDDGRFSLASLGPVDWNLDKIEPVAQIGDLVDPTAGGHDVLIYVHGYNTTFETAALDAARLSDGIQFVGETMVFSWPSRASLLDYGYDRESAMWSRDALQQVLNGLIASPVVGHVHGKRDGRSMRGGASPVLSRAAPRSAIQGDGRSKRRHRPTITEHGRRISHCTVQRRDSTLATVAALISDEQRNTRSPNLSVWPSISTSKPTR
jgi:hypothetical protein